MKSVEQLLSQGKEWTFEEKMKYYSETIDEEIILEIKKYLQNVKTESLSRNSNVTNTEPTIFFFENFPLNYKQVLLFEKEIANVFKVIFIKTPEELIQKKLSFEKPEVAQYNMKILSQIGSVVEYFKALEKVETIDGSKPFLDMEKELIQKLSL